MKRDAPESCAWAAIADEDSLFSDVNGVSVIKIDFCFVVDCSVSGISKFWSRVGTMSTMLAGALMLRRSFESLVAVAVPPVGRIKTLVDRVVVSSKGSWGVPAVEVAPVSLTADAMDPFMIPCLRAVVDMDEPVALGLCVWYTVL